MSDKLGKMGTFSRGQMSPTDEGDLQLAISHTGAEVVIRFGTPVTWIGLEPDKAEEFAKVILAHAYKIRRKAT